MLTRDETLRGDTSEHILYKIEAFQSCEVEVRKIHLKCAFGIRGR